MKLLPTSLLEGLAGLRAAPEIQARIDELASKANEGELSEEEWAEYAAYIDAIDEFSILQANARSMLRKQTNP